MPRPIPVSDLSTIGAGKNESVPGIISLSTIGVDGLIYRILNQNDYEAFRMLFRKMYKPLCQFCMRFVLVKEVAEEVVSDVFYTIWKNRERIVVLSSPQAYLFTAVRNRGYDHLRQSRRALNCDLEHASNMPSDLADSESLMIHEELISAVEHSVALLPKQCRLVFELSRHQGMKYKDIAVKLNISVKTVETQMGRALKHLRQSLPST